MPLLEREAQLASLGEYAGEARHGDGRMVLVAGEAGVGKSALVEQLQRDLPDAAWFWGACDGLFTPRPLGPLFDIAAKLGGELLELCRADAPRADLFSALLRQISEPGELRVLVVEDIHWADEATIDLLRFLGRRIRDATVLLIVTYRDDGLSATDPLRIALGDLATQRSVRRAGLAPLSAAATAVLAGDHGLDAAALYRLTGGNPFYVTEVVQSGMGEIPASARDAVLARVSRLPARAREVLDAAALIGARVEFPLLTSVSGDPSAAADELLESGLLSMDGTALTFRHEIVRRAVQEAVPPLRSGLTHTRILRALADLGCGDDARLAYHAEAAGDGPAVLRYAPAAARRRPGWAPTARPPPSSSGRCGSPAGWIPPRRPGSAMAWPRSRGCWTAGRTRPARWSGRWTCGVRSATVGPRVPRCAGFPAPCGGCAGARKPGPRPRRPSRCSNRWARAPSWPGRTRTWPAGGWMTPSTRWPSP